MAAANSLATLLAKHLRAVIAMAVVVVLIVTVVVFESNYSPRHYRQRTYDSTTYTHHVHPTRAQQAATLSVTNSFRRTVVTASQSFVLASSSLVRAIRAGDLPAARSAELHSQAAFDQLRASFAIGVTSLAPLDALVSDQLPGAAPQGLHAVERDLWSGHVAHALLAARAVADASVLIEFGVFRTILTPSAVCGRLSELLSWTVENVIDSSQERYSHRDMLDVRATVDFTNHVSASLVTLGLLVSPPLARELSQRIGATVLLTSPYANAPLDSSVSADVWRELAQSIVAVQSTLGQLDGVLNGLGTGRPYA